MNETDETIKVEPNTVAELIKLVKEINAKVDDLGKRLDGHDERFEAIDVQLEAVREGIYHNATRFDRLEGNFLLLRADVREFSEDFKKDRLALK